jgi:hypothetical protein
MEVENAVKKTRVEGEASCDFKKLELVKQMTEVKNMAIKKAKR